MQPTQQRLFPDPQPIVDRLGREFFAKLPDMPGVYRMHDSTGRVLYVGKAKSLRRRLCSYRVANPDRMPRRTLRLLRLVDRIEWEICADEAVALSREAELLLAMKPQFNRAGVWRGRQRWLVWQFDETAGTIRLRVMEDVEEGWGFVGPYGSFVRRLHQVLVRRIWCHFHPERGIAGMPSGWSRGVHGLDVTLTAPEPDLASGVRGLVERLFAGDVSSLPGWRHRVDSVFERLGWEKDLEFFTERYGPETPTIPGLDS